MLLAVECLKDRTVIQCQHRWQKVLNPEIVKGSWTKEVKHYGCFWFPCQFLTSVIVCQHFLWFEVFEYSSCDLQLYLTSSCNIWTGGWKNDEIGENIWTKEMVQHWQAFTWTHWKTMPGKVSLENLSLVLGGFCLFYSFFNSKLLSERIKCEVNSF